MENQLLLNVNEFNPENVSFSTMVLNKKTKRPSIYLNYRHNGKVYRRLSLKVKNASLPFGCSKYPQDASNTDPKVRFSLQVDLNGNLKTLEDKLNRLEELYTNHLVKLLEDKKTQKLTLSNLGLKSKDLKDKNMLNTLLGSKMNPLIRENDNEDYSNKFKLRVPFYSNGSGDIFTTYVGFYNKKGTKLTDVNNTNVIDRINRGSYHLVFTIKNTYFVSQKTGIPLDLQQIVLSNENTSKTNECAFDMSDDEDEDNNEETNNEENDEDDISDSEDEN